METGIFFSNSNEMDMDINVATTNIAVPHKIPKKQFPIKKRTKDPNSKKLFFDWFEEFKMIIGGAPVTQEFGEDMGADGYGKDAMACVDLVKEMVLAQ